MHLGWIPESPETSRTSWAGDVKNPAHQLFLEAANIVIKQSGFGVESRPCLHQSMIARWKYAHPGARIAGAGERGTQQRGGFGGRHRPVKATQHDVHGNTDLRPVRKRVIVPGRAKGVDEGQSARVRD